MATAGLLSVDTIELLADDLVAVFLEVPANRAAVELAARNTQSIGETLGCLEQAVGYGDGGFHTESITVVIPLVNPDRMSATLYRRFKPQGAECYDRRITGFSSIIPTQEAVAR